MLCTGFIAQDLTIERMVRRLAGSPPECDDRNFRLIQLSRRPERYGKISARWEDD